MLDAETKAKWVAALRSGDYKQYKNALARSVDGKWSYCCLGVLCKVEGSIDCENHNTDAYPTIAKMVPDWSTLARMNDGSSSFYQIADYIEKNIPVE